MDQRQESILRELREHSATLPAEAQQYWREHEGRYARLLETLDGLYSHPSSRRPKPRRILDVGPSYQTLLLARLFPDADLVTMGFEDARYKPSAGARHIDYDLNDAYFRDSWPCDEGYDLILMLEVIEHLYTAPRRVLGVLRNLAAQNGLIVVSTPNATFLGNRVALLCGRNPFEMLEDRRHRLGLGHYREYTLAELAEAGSSASLRMLRVDFSNALLDRTRRRQRFYDRITRFLPGEFRQMTTIVFEKSGDDAELPDPDRVALTLGDGWFPMECEPHDPSRRWRWTGAEAVVSFSNPRRNVLFYLKVAGCEHPSHVPREIAVVAAKETVHRLLTPPDGDTTQRIPIRSAFLGAAEHAVLRIRVSPTFVPAAVEKSADVRELGVRVLTVAMVAQ
ncbi:MAG: class I SAM-dependent methyltransferase [Acidobacteriota bacterium]|nr:class I SAM-dependent methyltransferase [Acidobacteriota bacterium]